MCSAQHSSPLAPVSTAMHLHVCASPCVFLEGNTSVVEAAGEGCSYKWNCCSNICKCAMWEKVPLGGETWMALDIFMPFLQTWTHPEFVTILSPPWGNTPCHGCSKAQLDLSWHLYQLLWVHKSSEKYSTDTHSHTCHPPITLKGKKSGSTKGVFSIFLHLLEAFVPV